MVRGSNYVRIALYRKEPNLLVILVVEDNLVKGSSGQAVQAMNILFGLPETTGLEQIALAPYLKMTKSRDIEYSAFLNNWLLKVCLLPPDLRNTSR